MIIKEVKARAIKDSRKDKTVEVLIKTDFGLFVSASPSGKSKGRYEVPSYKNKLDLDIQVLENFSDRISKLRINNFPDLKKVENIVGSKIGANTLYAFETSILKALATEQNLSLWEFINKKAKKFPNPVGNCIGGGLHTNLFRGKKPDFQEFLVIPKAKRFADSVFLMRKIHKILGDELRVRKALGERNDENAWSTNLNDEQVLEIVKKVKEDVENQIGWDIDIGLDIAASSFYTGMVYYYKNPVKRLKQKEQINYVLDLIDKYNLDYVEDPLSEEDFSGFNQIRNKAVRVRPTNIIVGDDLTVSSVERFKKAMKNKSINAIIIKPNQIGSLLKIKELVNLAKKKSIKTVFSHRSGETMDYALADFAFGFQADYIKTGAVGREREVKLGRLVDVEGSLG